MRSGPRVAMAATGALLILIAVAAPWLGASSADGLGRGPLLTALLGAGCVLVGVLGSRFPGFYRGCALLLLNTVVFVATLELTVLAGFRLSEWMSVPDEKDWRSAFPGRTTGRVDYFDQRDWYADHWRSYRRAWFDLDYHPFVLWRKAEFDSPTIHIDSRGIRRTPGAECGGEAFTVFMFGGSTMWGYGAPDSETIPAFLQALLSEAIDAPVCTVNLGEGAYVSTQELFALQRLLQEGWVPDLAIFYDGWNDLISAKASGDGSSHFHVERVADRLDNIMDADDPELDRRYVNASSKALLDWARESYTYRLVEGLLERPRAAVRSIATRGDRGELAERVTQAYLANYEMAQAIARGYGFETLHFWQPLVVVGDKPLTDSERSIRASQRRDRWWLDLIRVTYRSMQAEAESRPNLIFSADVFDAHPEQIYFDPGHVLPPANEIVAELMLEAIRERGLLPGAGSG